MPKVKVPSKSKPIPETPLRPIGDSIVLFKKTIDGLGEKIIDRSVELKVLQLLMLSEEHLMLDGPPGVAKSMLADFSFDEIKGSKIYTKRLMKGTMPEEVFGPMKIHKLRHESVVEFNTMGMMPEADFAYLDEVYRASDMLLESMLGVVNEREFINGSQKMRCPLIMCIGTTNFINDTDELEAFKDRWLVTVKTDNLKSSGSRMKMYDSFIRRLSDEQQVSIGDEFTIRELRRMINRRRLVELPDDVLRVYDELVVAVEKAAKSSSYPLRVSDRRRCQILKLVQACALLDLRDTATLNDLIVVQYGLGPVNDDAFTSMFTKSYENIVAAYKAEMEDRTNLTKIKFNVSKVYDKYDESLDNNAILEMHGWLNKALAAFADKRNGWASNTLQREADETETRVSQLKATIEEQIEKRNIDLTTMEK